MSSDGTFVLTDKCPPPGAFIEIEVLFPEMEKGSVVKMRAQGEVLRVEAVAREEINWGFAAVGKFSILRCKERAKG